MAVVYMSLCAYAAVVFVTAIRAHVSQQVWHVWGAKAGPYLARVPLLQRGIGYAQAWFANVQR